MRTTSILLAFALTACIASTSEARLLQQLPSASSPLASDFSREVQSTLQQAGSPTTSPEFAAAFSRALGYAQAPVPAEDRALLLSTVAALTGRAPAPSQEKTQLAEGIVVATNTQKYSPLAPALSPSGKEIYDVLKSLGAGK